MPRKYRNPPITEAVCEFRFSTESPWDMTVPGLMYEQLKSRFPKRKQIDQLQVDLGAIPRPTIAAGKVRLMREDEKHFVQVSPRLLSINHLAPYESWEQYFPAIEQAFAAYVRESKPKGFARIGLRYINLIVVPETEVALEQYFQFYPQVPPDFREIFAFRTGAQFYFNDERDMLKVEMTSAHPKKEGSSAMLLDLDYMLRKPDQVPIDAALDWVQAAHNAVENAFEICIQEPTRQLFGPAA